MIMKKAIITFSAPTESLNVHPNNMDYVENVTSIVEVVDILKKHYTPSDMALIVSIEITNY